MEPIVPAPLINIPPFPVTPPPSALSVVLAFMLAGLPAEEPSTVPERACTRAGDKGLKFEFGSTSFVRGLPLEPESRLILLGRCALVEVIVAKTLLAGEPISDCATELTGAEGIEAGLDSAFCGATGRGRRSTAEVMGACQMWNISSVLIPHVAAIACHSDSWKVHLSYSVRSMIRLGRSQPDEYHCLS